ncbi:hypothetical protein ACIFOE_23485 [Paenibacillus sp. NRS-1783]|uniref:hypothetical protein n=1 Tax=Paenibacillus sp. NRS-1783 TaxID=3233907 RepID=UPI003D29868A
MNRLAKEDVLPSLKELLKRIEQGEKDVLAYQKDALKQVIEQYGTKERPMSAYMSLENWLIEQHEKPIEIRSAMLWGGLWMMEKMGCIDFDKMRVLYGEFMSQKMNLR